jgi:hypothetical protein
MECLDMGMKRVIAILASSAFYGAAFAAPVTYHFSTAAAAPANPAGPSTFGAFHPTRPVTTAELNEAGALFTSLLGTSISGSFSYDPAVGPPISTSGGPLGNRGSSYVGSLTDLSADMTGGTRHVSDERGTTVVGNEAILSCVPPLATCDYLQLQADPGFNSPNANISGFTIGPYSVFNVRLFWLEGFPIPNPIPELPPNPIPDFLVSNNLPETLPSFDGRLAIDFSRTTDRFGTQFIAFYDNLIVTQAATEPSTPALLLAALGLLALRLRKKRAHPI